MKKTPKPENVAMNVTTIKKIGEKLQQKGRVASWGDTDMGLDFGLIWSLERPLNFLQSF